MFDWNELVIGNGTLRSTIHIIHCLVDEKEVERKKKTGIKEANFYICHPSPPVN